MSNDDARQGLGCFAVFDDEGSADEDVVDADGVLVGRDEGGGVAEGVGVEHDDVRMITHVNLAALL